MQGPRYINGLLLEWKLWVHIYSGSEVNKALVSCMLKSPVAFSFPFLRKEGLYAGTRREAAFEER